MTKKSLIESLKKKIPKGLTDLEIARYVYIEIGKQKSFDTRYFYGNAKAKKKIYRLAEEAKNNPEKFYNRKTLICVSISYLYQSILKEFGIYCDVVLDEGYDDGHLMPVIKLQRSEIHEKPVKIRADLQVDLERIQSGMQTREFGTRIESYPSYYEIPEEELKQIDKKIGYIKEDYKDNDIQAIAEELEGMNASDSLKLILQNPRIYEGVNLKGPVERRKYYGNVLNRLVKKYINKKIYMLTCYREKENIRNQEEKKREYALCAYSYDKEEIIPYLYSEKEKRFVPVTIEKLSKLQEEGLVIGTREHANGVKLLKRTIQKNVRKTIDKSR